MLGVSTTTVVSIATAVVSVISVDSDFFCHRKKLRSLPNKKCADFLTIIPTVLWLIKLR
jgi:hypothetical protein